VMVLPNASSFAENPVTVYLSPAFALTGHLAADDAVLSSVLDRTNPLVNQQLGLHDAIVVYGPNLSPLANYWNFT